MAQDPWEYQSGPSGYPTSPYPVSSIGNALANAIDAYGNKKRKDKYTTALANALAPQPVGDVAVTPNLTSAPTSDTVQSRTMAGAYNQPTERDIFSKLLSTGDPDVTAQFGPMALQSQIQSQAQANAPITPYQRANLGIEQQRATLAQQEASPEFAAEKQAALLPGQIQLKQTPGAPEQPLSQERFQQQKDLEKSRAGLTDTVDRNIRYPLLDKIGKVGVSGLSDNEKQQVRAIYPNLDLTAGSSKIGGVTGSPTVNSDAPGYYTSPVANAGGLSQSAIDSGALYMRANGGKLPPGIGFGSSGAGGERKTALQNRAAEIGANPNLTANPAQLKALTATLTEQTKYANTLERSLTNAENGFQVIQNDFAGKVNDSHIPIANVIANAAKYNLDPGEITSYKNALIELGNEYTQVFSRGGQVSDKVRAQGESIANGNLNLDDLAKTYAELQRLGTTNLNGTKAQVKRIHDQINGVPIGQGGPPETGPPVIQPSPQVGQPGYDPLGLLK